MWNFRGFIWTALVVLGIVGVLGWWFWQKSKPENPVYTQVDAQMISRHNMELADLQVKVKALEESRATTNEVTGRHETMLDEHDKQIATLGKKCSSSCPVARSPIPQRRAYVPVPPPQRAPALRAEAPASGSSSGAKFWGWFNYESSPSNPKPCLADRPIRGKPARCSTVIVMSATTGETEDQWTTRAAASQGVTGENKHVGKVSQ